MKKYFFRVDGGSIYSVAMGHITRCLKLADFISGREKARICFLMRDYKEGVKLVKKRYEVLLLERDVDAGTEIKLIRDAIPRDCYFICDIRNIGSRYISEIKKCCLKFVLFDDLGIKDAAPDVLINPSPFCSFRYPKNKYPGTDFLLGEKFIFLSRKLTERAHARDFEKKKYNIMAVFGGADPCNITEFFIRRIAPGLEHHNISLILGPAYKGKSALIRKYKALKNIKFYTDVAPLDNMFLQNDVAFVCGGDTCVEACASGIATFIISSIYYEKKTGELLHRKKMAYFVADVEDIKNNRIREEYRDVLDNNRMLLSALSKKAMGITDGRGQERVYNAIIQDN